MKKAGIRSTPLYLPGQFGACWWWGLPGQAVPPSDGASELQPKTGTADDLSPDARQSDSDPGTKARADKPPTPEPDVIVAVRLGLPGDPVLVWNIEKPPLAPQTYRAVKALVGAGEKGLSLRQLSFTGNWRVLLKRLRERGEDWKLAIQFPTKRGSEKRRYRIAPPRHVSK
jgi:hypothetical protein